MLDHCARFPLKKLQSALLCDSLESLNSVWLHLNFVNKQIKNNFELPENSMNQNTPKILNHKNVIDLENDSESESLQLTIDDSTTQTKFSNSISLVNFWPGKDDTILQNSECKDHYLKLLNERNRPDRVIEGSLSSKENIKPEINNSKEIIDKCKDKDPLNEIKTDSSEIWESLLQNISNKS